MHPTSLCVFVFNLVFFQRSSRGEANFFVGRDFFAAFWHVCSPHVICWFRIAYWDCVSVCMYACAP